MIHAALVAGHCREIVTEDNNARRTIVSSVLDRSQTGFRRVECWRFQTLFDDRSIMIVKRALFALCCCLATLQVDAFDWEEGRLELTGLPNAFRAHANVYSGGTPDKENGFRQLMQMGVKTIVSVDGARPDVETASRFGQRYVHFPLGYGGISGPQALALAKAVSELPVPIYIHCHHGKHRGPAAVMVACIGAGLVSPRHAESFLRIAGTNPKYTGLYEAVERTQRFQLGELKRADVPYPEVASVPPLTTVMIEIEKSFGELVEAKQRDWTYVASDGDADPSHDALLLKEHFAETSRMYPTDDWTEEFRGLLQHAHQEAITLESLLSSPRTAEVVSSLSRTMTAIESDCRRCHEKFRDHAHAQPGRDVSHRRHSR